MHKITRKIICRKCIGCAELINRDELMKIMAVFDTKEIIINPNNKTFGRSAYICKNERCVENAFKKGRIFKNLRVNIRAGQDESVIENIKRLYLKA